MQPHLVAEPGEEEQWVVYPTACLEVNQYWFVVSFDNYVVGSKISMGKSEVMKVANYIQETKKKLLIDGLAAAQGCPLDLLHDKAVEG
jgi:hypothetical protein